MEKKFLKIAIIAMLLICVCSTLVSALSFTATMTPSKKVVPESTEFTVEIKVSNLDVGANGINSLSGHLKYDKNIFETISESSIEGRNGWSHSFNAENDGKITLTKTSFVKTEEEVFQVTFKTKSKEDLAEIENKKGMIQFTGITASNSASDITANDISVEISIGQEEENDGNTATNGTLQVTPTANTTNTNANTNTNKAPTIGLSTNTAKNTTNTNSSTNTNTNKVAPYVGSTNTIEESIPHTGVEDTVMYLMFAVIAVAIVFYIKFERINKEMK